MTTNDTHVVREGHAPTPFTADEIRLASAVGKTLTLLAEVEGEPPSLRLRRYVEVDEEGATIEFSRQSIDGQVLEPASLHRTTWLELQSHASFPSSSVTIEPDMIDIDLGLLECLRYTSVDGRDVTTFWFARAHPGMPVRVVTASGDRITSTVTMISSLGQPIEGGPPT